MQHNWDVVIIGGGIAGVSAAKAIREMAFDGTVLLINGEDRPPYKRTKLSKHIASGFQRDEFRLQSPEWYHDLRIHRIDGQMAAQLDPVAKTLTLDSGEVVQWEKLIIATGATPCYPPHTSPDTPHTYVVRQIGDAERLIEAMNAANSQNALIVGMGVLGVEVAEQLHLAGKLVALIGRSSALMPRHLNPQAAALMEQACQNTGIHLLFNDEIINVTTDRDHLSVTLRSGVRQTDMLVCCVGATPDTTLARQAGLAVNTGILTNECLQTSSPDIFAAGDVAELPGGEIGGLWHSAEAQGIHAGKNAVGSPTPYPRLPFRLKCEVFGQFFFSMLPPDADTCQTAEYRNNDRYQCLYYRENRLCGAIMVNDGERAKQYERAVREGWTPDQMNALLAA